LFGKFDIIQYLLSTGAKSSIDIPNNNDLTLLHMACSYGNVDIVQYLIRNGAKSSINKK